MHFDPMPSMFDDLPAARADPCAQRLRLDTVAAIAERLRTIQEVQVAGQADRVRKVPRIVRTGLLIEDGILGPA